MIALLTGLLFLPDVGTARYTRAAWMQGSTVSTTLRPDLQETDLVRETICETNA
jgi:hypothetical protein